MSKTFAKESKNVSDTPILPWAGWFKKGNCRNFQQLTFKSLVILAMHAFTDMNSGILNSLLANIFCVSLSVWCNKCPSLVAIVGHRAFAKKIKVHFFLFSLYWSTNIFSSAKWKKLNPSLIKIHIFLLTKIIVSWLSSQLDRTDQAKKEKNIIIANKIYDNSFITHYRHN